MSTTNPYAVTIANAVQLVPEVRAHLSAATLLLLARDEYKAAGDLAFLNARYNSQIVQTLINFFNGENIAASRNVFKRATVEAFSYAFDLGYTDGGGKLPTDRESNDWLVARVEQEFGHIQLLYQQAKDIRKEKESYFQWVTDRADGYTRTLRDIYSMGKLRAMGNKMLTFTGPDGSPEHICQKIGGTCVKLKGKRHRASWWVNHDLMPYRGNPAFDCGGWECQHILVDDEGKVVTLR